MTSLARRHALLTLLCPSSRVQIFRRNASSLVRDTLAALRQVDTSALCDADKSVRSSNDEEGYSGLRLLQGIMPLNNVTDNPELMMVGVARTIQLRTQNDFLAVIQGMDLAAQDEVLVVNTLDSSKAVSGELFCAEAQRRGLSGIVIDGPVRDVAHLWKYKKVRVYAKAVTPYSGSIQSPGNMQVPIDCGGTQVNPGDLVVGDLDGVVVGDLDTFTRILPLAQQIQEIEGKLRDAILEGTPLTDNTNFKDHLESRLQSRPSNLEFKV